MERIGRYDVIRPLARGGMAEVLEARLPGAMGFAKRIVVKRMLPHLALDEDFHRMFLSEARLASLLNHPNVVQIFDFGVAAGRLYIAMELIDGASLRDLSAIAARRGGAIPIRMSCRLVAQVCEGLAYAHELSDPATGTPLRLVHRDISPDNVLVSRSGAVKVVDFGIAKAAGQLHRTQTGVVKGKFAYMSPEHLRGEPLDLRTDVFAAGVMLYQLVTGERPYDAESQLGILQAALANAIVPPRRRRVDLPLSIDSILLRMLAAQREDRYPSCRAVQADLERYLRISGPPIQTGDIAELVRALVPANEQDARAVPELEPLPGG